MKMMKKNNEIVNIKNQVILFLIPVVGYYAWWKIGKFWAGLLLNLSLGLALIPMILFSNFIFLLIVICSMCLKLYLLIKWTKEHNKRCDIDKEKM